jgi:UDP-N-acetyl-2-amino-2-deoxyglucuronate dehydrogenase
MLDKDKKIKFAVVGCGHIGKRHAEMIERNPESELIALVDVKEKLALGVEKYDVPFFHNIDDLLT